MAGAASGLPYLSEQILIDVLYHKDGKSAFFFIFMQTYVHFSNDKSIKKSFIQ